jgi:hypothetical protein
LLYTATASLSVNNALGKTHPECHLTDNNALGKNLNEKGPHTGNKKNTDTIQKNAQMRAAQP